MPDKKNRTKSRKTRKNNNPRGKNIRKTPNKRKSGIPQKSKYVSRRSEIYGIIIITISILLFLSFFSFGKPGIITSYLNDLFSYIFGVTKYFFAFLLLIWGISFFIKRIRNLPSSFGWGFLIIFLAVSGLISNNFNYSDIFDPLLMRTRGGVIGAGVFYGLYRLVGSTGAVIILSVLILIGILIVTRISIIELITGLLFHLSR